MLVPQEVFTSDDIFAFFLNRFSGKCWSLSTSFLCLGYKQIHVCVASGPLFSQGVTSWNTHRTLRYGTFCILARCFRPCRMLQYHVGGIFLLDNGKVTPETHWIHRPDTRFCGHITREASRYNLWKMGRNLRKSRTLLAYQRNIRVSWASTQVFSWDHTCPRPLPHALGFSIPMSTDVICHTPHHNITQSFPTIFRDVQSSRTERVWSGPLALSLSNGYHLRGGRRMSQIPALFPKIPYAVGYCGLSCCLSLGKRVKKGRWWSPEASASALKISWLRG